MKRGGNGTGRWAVVTALGVAVAAAALLWWFRDGPRRVYTGACGGSASISIDLSIYRHPLDFELGGSVGYALFYHPASDTNVPLYNDAYLTQDAHGSIPAPFVGWHFDGTRFSGPLPSYTYAPLPRTGLLRVFESAAQLPVPRDAPAGQPDPPFMNIFVDPGHVAGTEFVAVADCLAEHRDALNVALARMVSSIPSPYARFYRPLRLGGIAYGPPPYGDIDYMEAVARLRGAAAIPRSGRFLVYRGHAVSGVINRRDVEIGLDADGEITLKLDGEPVSFDPDGQGSKAGVSRVGRALLFDGDICREEATNCARRIEMVGENDDLSGTFLVFRKVGPHAYGA